jgi:hypothetical protein
MTDLPLQRGGPTQRAPHLVRLCLVGDTILERRHRLRVEVCRLIEKVGGALDVGLASDALPKTGYTLTDHY